MKISKFLFSSAVWLSVVGAAHAQHYNAIHGSNYSGGLGVYNNPSSIVNSPYKWDLTLIGLQFQGISNAINGKNFPFYLSPNAKFDATNGNFERKAHINTNIHLFNGRYAISSSKAIAFGANLKTYTQASSSMINYNDSVKGPRTFLFYNESNRNVGFDFVSSGWMELYASYAFTLWDQEASKLNVGATLKALRGLSGGYARVRSVKIQRDPQSVDEVRTNITEGSAQYALSATHGNADDFHVKDLFTRGQGSLAMDIGVEYIVKTQAVSTVFDDEGSNDYEWKIGISLLDLGWNKYIHSLQSRSVSSLKQEISGTVLQEKFNTVKNLRSFNDSLATIVEQSTPLVGAFNINNPARAVLNVDRYVQGDFYINGELSVNLLKDDLKKPSVLDSKLLTITPRIERKKTGFYFPVQYTRYNNLWIGAAVRVGPLLFGTHNLLNAFGSNKKLGSGAYLAITFRPRDFHERSSGRQYDCPTY